MKWLLAFVIWGVAFCFLLFMPPWQTVGEWQNWSSGEEAAGALKAELNRTYFGALPSYHPFGYKAHGAIPEGVAVKSAHRGEFYLNYTSQQIDWKLYGFQLTVLLY